ncbi:carbohydrate ABC transporter membrane protein 1, CUT1 family [Tistlia consotensis]|uniref:Carbohydrate ABC transporter membrane protein 1, CUT1 family n=1 Tax=Tistlia consotensis USBA 355 TaxID=560819 RepID=A0A1Y6BGK3_9PROT|nr:sugar ABC transporter permease [Tistlia consotensis]SMF00503.1 carbohydrate ABC transporter membrane protein 1, CUT1 family [Tistlia consotensis USBA 355]SNR75766.1 carbohydrate ABC transporter membrane protein 1, CUT1 family [Tistlia consotensis]
MAEASLAARSGARAEAPRALAAALRRRQALAAWSLTGPALLLMALLLIGPVAAVALLSLTDYQLGARSLAFVGLDNYADLAGDRVFWTSLTNTLLYVALVVPGAVGLGLGVALLIEAGGSLKSLYRAVFFVPVMATLIAMAISWEFMLQPSFGLVNLCLRALGLPGHNWLQEPDLALPVLAVIGIWQLFGFNMVLFLAGLVSIPRQLYEAAAMDGARSAWSRFRLVTLPMLGPVLLFVLVISAIRSFQVFDTVQVLTKGGPAKATEVLLYSMYAEGFEFFRSGYASAITVVFLVFVLILTLVKARILERRVHYG